MTPALKYGLIGAVGMSAWMLAEFALGLHTTRLAIGEYTSWGTEIIFVGVLWRMLHQRLYQANRTWLPVAEGLLHGACAGLVAAAGFYIFLSLYLHVLNPDYGDLLLEWRISHLRQKGIPEEDIRVMARAFLGSLSPLGLPVNIFGLYLLISLVVSPLFTLWLNWRRKEIVHVS